MRWERFLDEVARAGYRWLELGPFGYLPTQPERLSAELEKRGLHLCGGTIAGALQRDDGWQDLVERARSVATFTKAMGAQHLVFLPQMFRDERTGADCEARTLDERGWATLTRHANELGRLLRDDYGIYLCLHSHADSHVLTQAEIERFLDGTEPEAVWLCLDTGHVAYGGGDAVALIRRYPQRIGYVHIKQVDPGVLAQAREHDISFSAAVRRGVCVEPPRGVPDAAAVIAALKSLERPLFVVVEQDLYPCDADVPLPIAIRTREYLNTLGLRG